MSNDLEAIGGHMGGENVQEVERQFRESETVSRCDHYWMMPFAPSSTEIECRSCRKKFLASEANKLEAQLAEAQARAGDYLIEKMRLEKILADRNICTKCGVKINKHLNHKPCKAKEAGEHE